MANWILQGNPERYDVLADLQAGTPIEAWSITRHIHDVAKDDRAALWVSGRGRSGVYALGRVTGPPYEGHVSGSGWRRPEDHGATMWFCPVIFDEVLLDDPVPRDELKTDPRFAHARILTQPQAGNPFSLTDDEWAVLEEHASRRRHTLVACRDADNVWREVQHRAKRWQEAGVPVYTLKENVRNEIIGVTENAIQRRSDRGRSQHQTEVRKKQIANVWEALVRDGHTQNVRGSALRLAYALVQRAIPGVGFNPAPYSLEFTDRVEACRTFDDATPEVPGLEQRPPASRGGNTGGGGEGPIHAALKARIKADPVGTIGERLTWISEDLTERLGDEIAFITGDRVDLLMKDEDGNYVVIEVEPQIGPGDHIGFHQAAKYWVLVALAKGIALERVRRMVAATSIDSALRSRYRRLYGIESFEVPVP